MTAKKRILLCPLDWGLGHASRCIPIVRQFLDEGYEVLIASDEAPLALLQQEFPQLQFINFKGYGIRYSKYFFGLVGAFDQGKPSTVQCQRPPIDTCQSVSRLDLSKPEAGFAGDPRADRCKLSTLQGLQQMRA